MKPCDVTAPRSLRVGRPAGRQFSRPIKCGVAVFALTLLLAAGAARGQGVDRPAPSVSDEAVEQAIRRGVETLYSQLTARNDWEEVATPDAYAGAENESHHRHAYGGRTALAVLALLYASEDPEEPRIKKALKWLAEVKLTGTYATSLRISVWSKLNNPRLRPLLKADAEWLMQAMTDRDGVIYGTFYYGNPHPSRQADHSNTQYGVLGLRDAAIRGIEVPPKYWDAIEKHMIASQSSNGGWSYYPTQPTPDGKIYGNMTVGGLANLYITLDRLGQRHLGLYNGRLTRGCGMRRPPEAIDKALAWLDRNLPVDFGLKPKTAGDEQTWRPHEMSLYFLYGLERCGHASGRKTFGGLNWFERGARWIIARMDGQKAGEGTLDGSINASWTVLFLSKGRGPVFYNKLDTGADWANKPLDVANLSKYIGEEFEQRANWQVVDIDAPVETWLDAPCLFFNGHEFPPLTDEQKQKLRLYTDSGGTLVAEACCSKDEFARDFRRAAKEIWPEWELQMLDRNHPVFKAHHEFKGLTPKVMHLHDGCRSRVFFIVQDMSGAWHQDLRARYLSHFQFGMNLARYASDKRLMRSRLFYPESVLKELAAEGKPLAERPKTEVRITVADWPTDGARLTDIRGMRHLAELLDEADNVKLDRPVVEGGRLDPLGGARVLHMSGHETFTVSDENLEKLRAFIAAGGLIWADAQCGREAFNESFAKFLEKLLPGAALKDVPASDPLITGQGLSRSGFDVRRIRYKQAMLTERFEPLLKEVRRDGRRVLVYSPCDMTCGMDGHDCWGCRGPQRNDALKMAANIVLSMVPLDVPSKEPPPAPAPAAEAKP